MNGADATPRRDADAETSQPVAGVGAGSERCSSCGTRKALGWRTDRESKQVTCNKCYLRKYKPVLTDMDLLLLEGEQAKKSKGKAKRSRNTEASDVFAEDQEADSAVASGTAVDLSAYPAKIRVECSPVERVNGLYSRAEDLTNGQPYYNSMNSKKVTQLFLHGKEWKFGHVHKTGWYAKVKANKNLTLPTEPYPFAWKVLHATLDESKETQDAPAMRVIDLDLAASLPAEASLPAQPAEKGVSLLLDSHAAPHSKKRRRVGDVPPEGSAAAKKTKGGELTSGGGLAETKDAKSDGSSEDESGSESDSESSSSSSSGSEEAPLHEANGMTVTEVEVPKEATEAVYDKGAAERFKTKLHSVMKKLTTQQVRAKLRLISRSRHQYTKLASMPYDDLDEFCDRMYEEHGKPMPKPPPGEPPRHILEKAGHPVPPPPPAPRAQVIASTATEAEDLMPHRDPNQQPQRGCWQRPKLGKFNPEAKRIGFHDSGSGDGCEVQTSLTVIPSMRGYLSHLWFIQPGAMVNCDICDEHVPLSCGFLQGVNGRPQFAQNQFVCRCCM